MRHSLIAFAILGFGLCHTVIAQGGTGSNHVLCPNVPAQGDTDSEKNETHMETQSFQTCAGLGSVNASTFSQEDAHKLKGLLDAGFDLYSFLRSHRSFGSVKHLIYGNSTDQPAMDGLYDASFIKVWFQVNLKPQLPTLSKDHLSCLSKGNFSCESYQALVWELSPHKEEMSPARQRMVYLHFIKPFLSRNSTGGCVEHSNSSDWLMRNFQSFASFALFKDLIELNMNFSAIDALEKLTPEQKAELILHPELASLDNHTIIKVLKSLIQPLLDNQHLNQSVVNMTAGHTMNSTNVTEPHGHIPPKLKGFLEFLKPLGRFIHRFVSTVHDHEKNVSTIKGHVLTQVVVNWTLSELAGYFSHNYTLGNQTFIGQHPSSLTFNITDAKDWFQHVVVPILKRFLPPGNHTEALQDLTAIFNHVLALNANMDPEPVHPTAICRLNPNNNNRTCSVSKRAENLAVVLRCVATANLNLTGEKIKSLVTELRKTLRHHIMNASSPNVTYPSGRLPAATFSPEQLRDADLIRLWADIRLAPALPTLSSEYASCLSAQRFSCKAFQVIVYSLGQHTMDRHKKELVYTEFIEPFLSRNDTQDPGCVRSVNDSSRQWLVKNFGPFSVFAKLRDFNRLNSNFSAMEVLPLLTATQLGELAVTPGQLRDPTVVAKILYHVKDDDLGEFFDVVSNATQSLNLTQDVRCALLQQVFDRANLSDSSVNDTEVVVWLHRLGPLVANLKPNQVHPFFSIILNRDCNTIQQGLVLLNSTRHTLMNDTQKNITSLILQTLREPTPLRCYKNNSFYVFLKETFLGFELPKLTSFLSLIPPGREPEVINSISRGELGALLRKPHFVDNDTELCTVFNNYNRTPEFLEKEKLPVEVRQPILPCVWPLALAAEDEAEADQWFDVRLEPYLPFLNKDLLSSADTLNASCLPFRKLVSFLGTKHNFSGNGSDFTQEEAYAIIKTYLTSETLPKCYSATDPRLNSTAWFVHYIGVFVPFVTSDDLDTFGSQDTLKVFTVNPLNIELFNTTGVPAATTASYVQLIFLQNVNFNPLMLPPVFQCGVPGSAYSTLSQENSLIILGNLNQSCTNVEPEISSALAGNIQTVNANTISALGQESAGLTVTQITSAPPSVILNSLQTFSTVSNWNQGQLFSIITILLQQNYPVNTASSLVNLGTLVGGVPSRTLNTISPQVCLDAARNPAFVTNLQSATPFVQQTYVKQIIRVDAAPQQLLVNVPDSMATQIPRNLVLFQNTGDVAALARRINKKRWRRGQASLFFGTVATGFDEPDDLSEDVLQGFSCSRVRRFQRRKTRRLIRACRRRRNRRRVVLRQTQLTCMYNFIKREKPQDFANYPSDMLLYYNYADIPQANCTAYFTELGNADFTVLNRALRRRRAILVNNARQCLAISGTTLSRPNVEVLGNMACILDRPYIQNSDPEILEKMKNCNDFSDVQSLAMQTVLIQGNTKYGPPARWRERTLNDLGILPLYFSSDFWKRFNRRTKRNFLKRFLRRLRRNKTQKRKLKRLFRQLNRGLRTKRGANECTEGNITRVTISDDAFPFGYDATQFGHCLSAQVVKENLASLTEKVDEDELQRVILDRLVEAYPSGLPDEQVQLLGSVSRVATATDFSKWTISSPDTLAALMNSDDGEWEPELSKLIVTKFLSGSNNSLGSSELNALGGPNLCALDTSALQSISNTSIQGADALEISNCTTEKKKVLFETARQAFPVNFLNRDSEDTLTSYQLLEPYLGGASIDVIRGFSSCNVSMDIETFIGLDEPVVLDLTVPEVSGLLGSNLDDLASYENETVVQSWISRQLQSELDTLGLGLTGGRAETSTTASSNSTEAATTAATTAATATTVTTATTTAASITTASAGNKGSSYSLPFIFLMLSLAFLKIQIV